MLVESTKGSLIFTLEKARKSVDSEDFYYVVCQNNRVVYPISNWTKRFKSTGDGRPHVYITTILRFCKFLLKRNTIYYNATKKDIRDFFTMIVDFDNEGNYCDSSQVLSPTIDLYRAALVSFYRHLLDFYDNKIIQTIEVTSQCKTVEQVYILKTNWLDINIEAKRCVDFMMDRHKVNDKEYIKEYSEAELAKLYRAFRKPLHKVIFALTLKGMRIDEVLSIKLKDYDAQKMIVQPSRSKGRKRIKSNIRTIVVGPEVVQLIESYIFHEREPARRIVEKEKRDSDYLLVTVRKKNDIIPFTPYKQSSFRSALKSAARRAGIKSDVRTHAGRSHRSIELTRLMHNGILTDEQLRLVMGWQSMDSHRPYDEHVHKEEADKILEKIAMKRIERLEAMSQKEE